MRLPRHWPLLLLVFLDLIGFGMVIADVQIRAERFHAPGWLIGVALSSMFVVQILCSPIWGSIADRIGRKRVVIICTILSALSMAVYGLATDIGWIIASRILAGVAAANVAVSMAWVSLATPEEDRTAEMGRMGAALSAGLILGPAIGGFLAKFGGNQAVGWAAAGCSMVGVAVVAFYAKDVEATAEDKEEQKLPMTALLKEKSLLALMSVSSIAWLALACLEGTFARLLERAYQKDQFWFGIIFGFESLIGFVVQAFLLGAFAKRWNNRTLVTYGLVMQGVGLASMPFFPIFGLVFIGAALYSFGSAVFGPSLNAWCAMITPDRLKGTMFGALQAARSFGFIVGPIVGGAMFDWKNWSPYLLAGVVCLVASAISSQLPQAPKAENAKIEA